MPPWGYSWEDEKILAWVKPRAIKNRLPCGLRCQGFYYEW
jgi:hypothetical protein